MSEITLSTFRARVAKLEADYQRAQEDNKRREELQEKLAKLRSLYTALDNKLTAMGRLKTIIVIVMNKYQKVAVAVLEQEIQSNIDLVFPEEHYSVKIDFDPNRGQSVATLQLGKFDQAENQYVYGSPSLMNGGFVKQLISFGASSSLLLMMNGTQMYLDEAFNSGDGKSLSELRPLFVKLFDRGMQIIGIEHKGQVFSELPAVYIDLVKDRFAEDGKGKVVVSSVTKSNIQDWHQLSSALATAAEGLTSQFSAVKEDVEKLLASENPSLEAMDTATEQLTDALTKVDQSLDSVMQGLEEQQEAVVAGGHERFAMSIPLSAERTLVQEESSPEVAGEPADEPVEIEASLDDIFAELMPD